MSHLIHNNYFWSFSSLSLSLSMVKCKNWFNPMNCQFMCCFHVKTRDFELEGRFFDGGRKLFGTTFMFWWDEWTKGYESMNIYDVHHSHLLLATSNKVKSSRLDKLWRVSKPYPVCTAHSSCSRTWLVCVTSIAAIYFIMIPAANNSPFVLIFKL